MCKQCEVNPVYEFTNQRKLCSACFVRYFQKKFFYTIRKFAMIKRSDTVAYHKSKDFRGAVLENLLEIFAPRAMIKLLRLPSQKKFAKLAIASTLDAVSDEIVHAVIKGNINNLKMAKPFLSSKKLCVIKPLYLFLDEEVLLYAKIKKLKCSAENLINKSDKIKDFINELEKKHPELKRAVVKSYLKIFS